MDKRLCVWSETWVWLRIHFHCQGHRVFMENLVYDFSPTSAFEGFIEKQTNFIDAARGIVSTSLFQARLVQQPVNTNFHGNRSFDASRLPIFLCSRSPLPPGNSIQLWLDVNPAETKANVTCLFVGGQTNVNYRRHALNILVSIYIPFFTSLLNNCTKKEKKKKKNQC